MTPDREAIERGLQFEKRIANALSGTQQPGSGNKFYARSDVVAHGLIISCKSEKNLTFSKLIRHLQEAIELGHGSGNIPALAIESVETADELVIMRVSDFVNALAEVKIPEKYESKGLEKRATAEVPIMLR